MRILVTGGAGFIGSHVVDAYIEAGHHVVVVDDLSTGRQVNLNPQAKFYRMDILDDKLQQVLQDEKIELVNHHAAQIKVKASLEDPYFDVKVNVLGSVLLLDLCRRSGVRKFIYASSGGAMYGEADRGPFTENDPPHPFSVYGASKSTVESYVDVFRQTFGMEYVVLRYANVYGPRQDAQGEGGVVAIFTNGMLHKAELQIFGDGFNVRDFVYVKDVAQANLLALHYPLNDAFNIGTGEETTVNQLYDMLGFLMDYTMPAQHIVPRLGDLKKSVLNNEKAKNLLKWEPSHNLKAGLQETIKYYRKPK